MTPPPTFNWKPHYPELAQLVRTGSPNASIAAHFGVSLAAVSSAIQSFRNLGANLPHRSSNATERAINAEPWEPLPGMVKLRCSQCRFLFAAPSGTPPATACPDCKARQRRPGRGHHVLADRP